MSVLYQMYEKDYELTGKNVGFPWLSIAKFLKVFLPQDQIILNVFLDLCEIIMYS